MKSTQFFYQNSKVKTAKSGNNVRSIVRSDDTPLAEQTVDHQTALLLADQNGSVLGVNRGADVKRVAYAAYGHSKTALQHAGLAAFNSEWLDPTSELYILGNGYRIFSSTLMRFLSADVLSPFDDGGLNAYCYCFDDPVNLTDPSGHFGIPYSLRKIFSSNASLVKYSTNRIKKQRNAIFQEQRKAMTPLSNSADKAIGQAERFNTAKKTIKALNKSISKNRKRLGKHNTEIPALTQEQKEMNRVYNSEKNLLGGPRSQPFAGLSHRNREQDLSGLTHEEREYYDRDKFGFNISPQKFQVAATVEALRR